jgi:hypothetical protein
LRRLNEQVRRNRDRFPEDFIFEVTDEGLAKRLDDLEQTTEALSMQHDTFARNTRVQLKQVFDAIRELMTPPETQKKRPIGFITGEEKTKKDG